MHDTCPKAECGISVHVQNGTLALQGSEDRADQMMAHTTLALHLLAFILATEPKLAISLFYRIHPAMCPGLVYNGLLTAKMVLCLPLKPVWMWRVESGY